MLNKIRKRIRKYANNPTRVFRRFNHTKIQRILPDVPFLRLMIKARLGYSLNLQDPKTFNEKLQWLKLYDHNLIYTDMVDKYEAKKIISSAVGEDFVVQTYGVWDRFEDIDFDSLPEQFVLKTTHDCGGVFICRDKSSFDREAVSNEIKHRLEESFFWQGREWPYKNVRPRILAEKFLTMTGESASTDSIADYKMMCFNGKAQYCLVCTGRNSKDGLRENFFDRDWNPTPFKRNNPESLLPIARPAHYEKMIEIAEIISKDIPFLRVDFFEAENRLFVGELTFFPANGFGAFIPEEWDRKLGDLIELPSTRCQL